MTKARRGAHAPRHAAGGDGRAVWAFVEDDGGRDPRSSTRRLALLLLAIVAVNLCWGLLPRMPWQPDPAEAGQSQEEAPQRDRTESERRVLSTPDVPDGFEPAGAGEVTRAALRTAGGGEGR